MNERGVEFSQIDTDIGKQKDGSTSYTRPVARHKGENMYRELKGEIDDYIQEWYFGEKHYKFAFDIGEFLWYFQDYIDYLDLSESTKKKHRSNCWCIGMLECQYGYRDKFYPRILMDGPHYEYEFNRKFSDSKYAIQSYRSTWNKLHKYIEVKGYLINYTSQKYIDESNLISELEEIALQIFNCLSQIDNETEETEIVNNLRKIICNYIDYEDRWNDEHYIEQIKESIKNLELVKTELESKKIESNIKTFIKELEAHRVNLIELIINI